MIKSILAAVAVAGISFAAPMPVEAQARCYHESSTQAVGYGKIYGCRVSSRYNSNGHKVWDVVWHDGVKSSYVLWDDGTSETFSAGTVHPSRWKVTRNKFGERIVIIFNQAGSVSAFSID